MIMNKILYTIRTKDNRPIVFDAKEQFANGGFIEFHFPKEMAEVLLTYLKEEDPDGEFIMYPEDMSKKDVVLGFTAEDIHAKAIKEELESEQSNKVA